MHALPRLIDYQFPCSQVADLNTFAILLVGFSFQLDFVVSASLASLAANRSGFNKSCRIIQISTLMPTTLAHGIRGCLHANFLDCKMYINLRLTSSELNYTPIYYRARTEYVSNHYSKLVVSLGIQFQALPRSGVNIS